MDGPRILFTVPLFGGIPVTETVRNTWIVMAVIIGLCLWLTHDMKVIPAGRRQLAAEKIVKAAEGLVTDTMGGKYRAMTPYIAALFSISFFGSISSLTGLRPLTADLSTTLSWSLLTFVMVQLNNIRYHGVGGWLKSFTRPLAFMTPLNIVSELANPISMSFRHFGNIAAGMVITGLLYSALGALSRALLGWLPGGLGAVPILQVGIPAVLSIYFDLFTGFLQAYIICMLTMVFVAGAGD